MGQRVYQQPRSLPGVMLLDLDDTILDDSSLIEDGWRVACERYAGEYQIDPGELRRTIRESSEWYWGDPERHRLGRLDLDAARTDVVRLAMERLAIGHDELAARIARAYAEHREAGMEPLPEAVETVRWLRSQGCRLALLTNGAAEPQRRKISRFGLDHLFEAVFVEGEVGFGKPDDRIYRLALERLSANPADTWMVGDNLEWDVAAPQRHGLLGVWIDRHE